MVMGKSRIVEEYQDRKMTKWAGFYLSEHTQEISKEKKQREHVNAAKELMTTEEIDRVLCAAFLKTDMISVQRELTDSEGRYFDDIKGYISGFDKLGIFLGDHKVDYDEIRNVSIVPFKKWSQIDD